MRLPRVRFTVRRMMVAVAIVGLLLAIWVYQRNLRLDQLSQFYRLRATEHRRYEAMYRRSLRGLSADLTRAISRRVVYEADDTQVILGQTDAMLDMMRGQEASETKRVEYHRAMGTKYERAASVPGLPVEPDPTEPN